MNTAYRVWDGEQMYHYGDEGICLSIGELGSIDGKVFGWSLWLEGYGVIAHSGDGKSVLMWGTGLNDKNGRQIYDRDMLIGKGMTHPLLVEWSDYYGAFRVDEDTKYLFHMLINYGLARYELKVIGDVYQNPDLLEGAE
ncbi:YopX family protein [Bacillus sp. SIMBA_008]|uniref:YopX family protein n=1 Tax=Bacillus TaxID=1386 RepID=UPI00119C3B14|nr:YopX family protein [Bacillus subtilis]TWH31137.1 YopX protein [Bacillus subtilis J22]